MDGQTVVAGSDSKAPKTRKPSTVSKTVRRLRGVTALSTRNRIAAILRAYLTKTHGERKVGHVDPMKHGAPLPVYAGAVNTAQPLNWPPQIVTDWEALDASLAADGIKTMPTVTL